MEIVSGSIRERKLIRPKFGAGEIKIGSMCTIHDGGDGRVIVGIPLSFAQQLKLGPTHQDYRDVVRDLFAKVHEGSLPLWSTAGSESYQVEMAGESTPWRLERLLAFIHLIENAVKS